MGAYVEDIASELASRGHEIRVLVHANSPHPRTYRAKGVEVVEYPISLFWKPRLYKHSEIIASLKSSPLALLELVIGMVTAFSYLLKYSRGTDLIHAVWYLPSGLVASCVKPFRSQPLVVTALGAEFHLPNLFILSALLSFVHRSSDAHTANSRFLADLAQNYGLDHKQIQVIPTAINVNNYSQRPAKASGRIVIACVSRMIKAKQVPDLIRAVALLPAETADKIELWLVGDGPDRAVVEKLVDQHGFRSRSRFYGMVSHGRLLELLPQMDILVNPTTSDEGMPTINLEAMVVGVCPVATDGYGNNEVIRHESTGYVYPPRDVKRLAQILQNLVDNPAQIRLMGEAASRYIKENQSIQLLCGKYVEIYERLLKRPRVAA